MSHNVTTIGNVQQFKKLMAKNVVYSSTGVGGGSRNKRICVYRDSNEAIKLGQIQAFFLSKQGTTPFCLVKTYRLSGSTPIDHLPPPTVHQFNCICCSKSSFY